MFKVGHFVTHPIQYFAPLYRELTNQGIALTVLFGSDFGVRPSYDAGLGTIVQFDTPLLDGYDYEFLKYHENVEPPGATDRFRLPDLIEILSAHRLDLLWIHGWGSPAQFQLAQAARHLNIPYVLRGESTLLEAPKYSLRWFRRWFVTRTLFQHAAGCLYVGLNNRAFYRSLGVPNSRLFPAHYSIDARGFQALVSNSSDRRQLRLSHGAADDDLVIITVAKLIRRKRVADLLHALANLPSNFQLWVIGDGSERASLQMLGRQLMPERVHWLGFKNQSQLPALLGAADLFALASDEETWGLVVNEAMACGLPCLVSDKVGCAADLIESSVTGYSYPCGDVEQLRYLIGVCSRSRSHRLQMGAAASAKVHQHYCVQATARQLGDAFASLMTG